MARRCTRLNQQGQRCGRVFTGSGDWCGFCAGLKNSSSQIGDHIRRDIRATVDAELGDNRDTGRFGRWAEAAEAVDRYAASSDSELLAMAAHPAVPEAALATIASEAEARQLNERYGLAGRAAETRSTLSERLRCAATAPEDPEWLDRLSSQWSAMADDVDTNTVKMHQWGPDTADYEGRASAHAELEYRVANRNRTVRNREAFEAWVDLEMAHAGYEHPDSRRRIRAYRQELARFARSALTDTDSPSSR